MNNNSNCAKETFFFTRCFNGKVHKYNMLNKDELTIVHHYMQNTCQTSFTIKNETELVDFIFSHKIGE